MATSKKAMEMRHVKAMEKAGVPKKIVAEERKEAAGYKKGGKIDGIAKKGKTQGKMIAMKKGGKC